MESNSKPCQNINLLNQKNISVFDKYIPVKLFKNRLLNKKGFTLVETIVAGFAILAIGFSLIGIQKNSLKNQEFVWENFFAVQQTNAVIDNFTKELRASRQGDNGSFALATLDDSQISFYSDIDFDNQTEKIRYFLSGSQLIKGTIEPEGYPTSYPLENEKQVVMAENISNNTLPVFYYYNADWPADTVNNPLSLENRLSNARLVKIKLKINPKPDNPNKEFISESFVQVRMLKDNL